MTGRARLRDFYGLRGRRIEILRGDRLYDLRRTLLGRNLLGRNLLSHKLLSHKLLSHDLGDELLDHELSDQLGGHLLSRVLGDEPLCHKLLRQLLDGLLDRLLGGELLRELLDGGLLERLLDCELFGELLDGLGVELDGLEEWYEREPATETFEVDSGTIEKGTAAALHFELRGIRDGRAVIVLEHVTRLHDDLAPHWPQPAGHGCYRVTITGEPNYTLDLQLLGSDGDHNTAGLKATAMRLINAIPDVVEAPPGLVTALALPQVSGRGLVS